MFTFIFQHISLDLRLWLIQQRQYYFRFIVRHWIGRGKWAKHCVIGDITLTLHSYMFMWCAKMIIFWKDTIVYLNLEQFLIFLASVWFYSMEIDKWTTEIDVFLRVSFVKRRDFQHWKDKFIASITRWIKGMMFFAISEWIEILYG